MAEYYAVLTKAVAGLIESAESRRKVYDKARNALIGQLKAINPPLPTAEISRQRLELEEAIRRVERESSAAAISASPPAVRQQSGRASEAPRAPPAASPADASPADTSPTDAFRRTAERVQAAPGEPTQPRPSPEVAPRQPEYRPRPQTEQAPHHEQPGAPPAYDAPEVPPYQPPVPPGAYGEPQTPPPGTSHPRDYG
ncbi:MAG: hypothetical protein ACTSP2_09755, partial [Alphaproteobacteria bacterium]